MRALKCLLTILGASLASAVHGAVPAYTQIGSFTIGFGPWDIGPDGLVYRVSGSDILREDAVNGSTYTKIGSLQPGEISSYGASFLRVSPDGSKLAIGDGQFSSAASVHIVNVAALNPAAPSADTSITSPNFDAAWNGNNALFVTGARSSDFTPIVNQIDLGPSPSLQTIITGAGQASGGIAIRSGTLFTGSGYLPTGQIRSFSLGGLGGAAIEFSTGTLVATVLSASPLGFDGFGNLLVGGGDSFSGTSDIGYAAVLSLDDPGTILKLSPAGSDTLYAPEFNPVTQELVVYDTDTGIAYRYAIPGPASGAILVLGLFARKRRR